WSTTYRATRGASSSGPPATSRPSSAARSCCATASIRASVPACCCAAVERRAPGTSLERHVATVWESIADAIGDHDALVHGERRISWSAFDDRAARLAAAFVAARIEVGARVALCLYNAPEYVEAAAAALKQRLVPAHVNY